MNKRRFTLFYTQVLFLGMIICSGMGPTLAAQVPSPLGGTAKSALAPEDALEIRIYSVPPAFRLGYIHVIERLVSQSHKIEETITNKSIPGNITGNISTKTYTESLAPISEKSYQESSVPNGVPGVSTNIQESQTSFRFPSGSPPVEYDAERQILTVATRTEEHAQIEKFLQDLAQVKSNTQAVVYRIALLKRTLAPSLIKNPVEFDLRGTTGKAGLGNKNFPVWADDLRQRFRALKIDDTEFDRDEIPVEFSIQGHAPNRRLVEELIATIRATPETQLEQTITEHDYLQESGPLLQEELAEIYPADTLPTLAQSLQKMEVYKARTVSYSIGESSLPGFYKTVMEDGYSATVRVVEGLRSDQSFQAEISLYNKYEEKDANFDERRLQLSSSLITRYGQINIVGLRGDDDDRYVLIFTVQSENL